MAIRQNADGVWGDPHRLGRGTAPQAEVDGVGTVTAIWTRTLPGSGPQVMASRRVVGRRWTKPFPVSAPVASEGSSAHGAFQTDLAVSHDGAVLVSWLWGADDSGASRVQARYRPARHRWHRIVTLSPVEARSPVSAAGDDGRAVVVYTVFARAYAFRRTAEGWTRPQEIGRHVEPPQVAMDDAGDVAVVWGALETDGIFRPQAVTRRTGDGWTEPHTLDPSLAESGASPPSVAIGPRGHTTAAWIGSAGRVEVADHPVNGSWSDVTQVAPAGDPLEATPPDVDVTAGRSGAVLLSWTRRETPSRVMEAAYRPPHQDWQPPARVSPEDIDATAPEAFVAVDGRAVEAWRGYDATRGAHLQLRKLRP